MWGAALLPAWVAMLLFCSYTTINSFTTIKRMKPLARTSILRFSNSNLDILESPMIEVGRCLNINNMKVDQSSFQLAMEQSWPPSPLLVGGVVVTAIIGVFLLVAGAREDESTAKEKAAKFAAVSDAKSKYFYSF